MTWTMTILNMIQNAELLLAGQAIPEPAMPFKKMPFIEVCEFLRWLLFASIDDIHRKEISQNKSVE